MTEDVTPNPTAPVPSPNHRTDGSGKFAKGNKANKGINQHASAAAKAKALIYQKTTPEIMSPILDQLIKDCCSDNFDVRKASREQLFKMANYKLPDSEEGKAQGNGPIQIVFTQYENPNPPTINVIEAAQPHPNQSTADDDDSSTDPIS